MTKAEIVNEIVKKTGLDKVAVDATVEGIMESIKNSMIKGENVYLREFGTFHIKKRAAKTGRNISKGTPVMIPAHNTVKFKPGKEFVEEVKAKVKIK
jgi:DNA-binding protein HU-beta